MKLSAFVVLSLLACGCASDRQGCCVGQGPDWVVATFGKEKAAEINAIGYIISAPSVARNTQKMLRTGNELEQYKVLSIIFLVLTFALLLSKQ